MAKPSGAPSPFKEGESLESALKRGGRAGQIALQIMACPKYDALWKRWGSWQALLEAGFFPEQANNAQRQKARKALLDVWRSAQEPLRRAKSRWISEGAQKPVVFLLISGCFAPFHAGHRKALMEAKKRLRREGYEPLLAIVSPSAQSYAIKKGIKGWSLQERLRKAQGALWADRDWAQTDSWEGEVPGYEINFPMLIERWERLGEREFGERFAGCAFVFGADNALFWRAFCAKGLAVCLWRDAPGEEGKRLSALWKQARREAKDAGALNRVFFERGKKSEATWFSSTKERSAAKKDSWKTPRSQGAGKVWALREDASLALEALRGKKLAPKEAKALSAWEKRLRAILKSALPSGAKVMPVDPAEQSAIAREWAKEGPLVSLDVWEKGDINLEASRRFDWGGLQKSALAFAGRPGFQSLRAQARDLPKDNRSWILFDDDSASGFTLRSAKAALRGKIKIKDSRSLLEAWRRKNKAPGFWDVVDARDFLPGARHGGLVCAQEGAWGRAPYMWPFVDLSCRAKMAPKEELRVSSKLWASAEVFFKEAGWGRRKASRMDSGFAKLMGKLGMGDWPMGRICGFLSRLALEAARSGQSGPR